jgi:hypothetical protein
MPGISRSLCSAAKMQHRVKEERRKKKEERRKKNDMKI